MCLYPKVIKNPKYRSNKKNGGNIPNMTDNRVAFVPVGCGMCMECMKQKANNWKTRLMEDIKVHTNGHFVTMTFSEESYNKLANEIKAEGYTLDNEVATLAVRRFLERWRKQYKKSVRHWLITELGQTNTERIHLHGIIFTDKPADIQKHWQYGWVTIGNGKKSYVSPKTVNYITKYVTKLDPLHKYYKPKILCSAGIGANYTKQYNFNKNAYKDKETDTTYKTKEGFKIAMPIYWRNKRYTEEEREKLWIQKLDENIRYIGGEKVKADDDKTIQKLLKFYQKRNKELGYGNPEDWEAAKYEHERRVLKQQKKMPPAAFLGNSITELSPMKNDGNKLPLAAAEHTTPLQRQIDWEENVPF